MLDEKSRDYRIQTKFHDNPSNNFQDKFQPHSGTRGPVLGSPNCAKFHSGTKLLLLSWEQSGELDV